MSLIVVPAVKRQASPVDLTRIVFQQLNCLLKPENTYILFGVNTSIFSEKTDQVFTAVAGFMGYFPDRSLRRVNANL